MPDENSWSAPQNSELLAAFHYGSGALVACKGHGDTDAYLPAAENTLAIWDASHRFPDAALLLLKSDDSISLGALNGGVIIEGRGKLNIGLLRASTRRLAPVVLGTAMNRTITSEDRFRRAFWAILSRIEGSALPRAYEFDFAGVKGTVKVDQRRLKFEGDFLTPQDFVAELRAACAIEDEVRYTLGDLDGTFAGDGFEIAELLSLITSKSDVGEYVFDAEGWPISCASSADFDVLERLSKIASALSRRDTSGAPATISVLSGSNAPILSGSVSQEGSVKFFVH